MPRMMATRFSRPPRPGRRARTLASTLAGTALVLPVMGAAAHASLPTTDPASATTATPDGEPVAPPTRNVYVSDIPWVSETNGLGPVERDTAVGGEAAGDGPAITVDGVTYDKGLGTHADSVVRLYLGGQCSAVRSVVGIDDSQGDRGSVSFLVRADGALVATSPVRTGTSATHRIDATVRGAQYVDLVVDKVGDSDHDHADWAGARLVCGDILVRGILRPTATGLDGTAPGAVTIPAVEGVEYLVDGQPMPAGDHPVDAGSIIVTVRALEGYQLDPDIAAPRWAFAFAGSTEDPSDEPTTEPIESPTAGPSDEPTAEPTEDVTTEPTEPTEDLTTDPQVDPTTRGSSAVSTESATPSATAGGSALPSTGAPGSGAIAAMILLVGGVLVTTLATRRARFDAKSA